MTIQLDPFPRFNVLQGYISQFALAKQLKITVRTLEYWAKAGTGPPRTKIGKRVFYRGTAVQEWLKEKEISTNEPRT